MREPRDANGLATVVLDAMAPDGDTIARRSNGSTILVAGGIPGERVEVRLPAGGNRQRAEIVRILSASPYRVTPACPYFGPCGGCVWQHIAYDEQLRLKRRMCEALLRGALGRRAPAVESTIAAARAQDGGPWNYRSKVHFVFGDADGAVLGHFQRGSKAIVPVQACPVHAADGNAIAFAVAGELRRAGVPAASPDLRRGTLRHIVVRVAANTDERLVTVVVRRPDRRVTEVLTRAAEPLANTSVYVNVHDADDPYLFGTTTRKVSGRSHLRERIGDVSYALSPTAFFQTNVAAAEVLVRLVAEAVPATATNVLDLYAGAGLFALPLAKRGHRVIAVEENADAVADGVEGRRLNGIDPGRCRFVAARVEDAIKRPRGPAADVVIIDPPRSGCERRVLEHIVTRLRPQRLVYVSCNPATLASDLSAAFTHGYTAERVQPVDMFPHTAHVEAVTVLRPGK